MTHQQYTANGAVPAPLAGSVRDTGTLQLAASWELDFFGKNRSALSSALGQVRVAQAEASAARMLHQSASHTPEGAAGSQRVQRTLQTPAGEANGEQESAPEEEEDSSAAQAA